MLVGGDGREQGRDRKDLPTGGPLAGHDTLGGWSTTRPHVGSLEKVVAAAAAEREEADWRCAGAVGVGGVQ